ncbi:DUF1833 family protein [Pseudomonas cremoricolorata]|uniref:DUF1833 domain-containing protein n=1 Tax=Pseudomonas cremoricolorata TaxID=157783 RepID=A0A089YES9_9PSED|nr:DUF1833 family protein [Pseudomonas cremoricolorata]AIR90233.1 hypothetical protein LK03_13425 [Pseudomonas cremoricolorata]
MNALEVVYASGGDDIISTLEISCPAWDTPVYLVQDFEDLRATTEAGKTVTFQASAIEVQLPAKDDTGSQTLTFTIDNVTGEAQRRLDASLEAEARVTLVYREYLFSVLTEPADRPYRMTAFGGTMDGPTVQIEAGYYDLINMAWNRARYTTEFACGLTYVG